MRVLHSFGREDLIDRAAVERLIGSLQRWLDPDAPPRPASGTGPGLRLVSHGRWVARGRLTGSGAD